MCLWVRAPLGPPSCFACLILCCGTLISRSQMQNTYQQGLNQSEGRFATANYGGEWVVVQQERAQRERCTPCAVRFADIIILLPTGTNYFIAECRRCAILITDFIALGNLLLCRIYYNYRRQAAAKGIRGGCRGNNISSKSFFYIPQSVLWHFSSRF